jgi:hypothetical protein
MHSDVLFGLGIHHAGEMVEGSVKVLISQPKPSFYVEWGIIQN